jgi:hypothetical protein
MIRVCPPGASDAPISHGTTEYPPFRAQTDRDHPLNGVLASAARGAHADLRAAGGRV